MWPRKAPAPLKAHPARRGDFLPQWRRQNRLVNQAEEAAAGHWDRIPDSTTRKDPVEYHRWCGHKYILAFFFAWCENTNVPVYVSPVSGCWGSHSANSRPPCLLYGDADHTAPYQRRLE